MASLVQGEFSIGAVMRRSLAVLRDNLLPFIVLFLVLNAPSSLYEIRIAGRYGADSDIGLQLLRLMETFLSYLATAAVTYAAIQELRGRRVGFREFCARGLALGGVAIRVALLSSICFVLGLIALVVPAFVLLVIWWVAIPVAVAERLGAVASLRRSTELTKGYRWRIFALMLAFFAAAVAVGVVFAVLVVIPSELLGSSTVAADRLLTIAVCLWTSFFMAAQSVLAAVGYYYLRVAKEGVGIEEIAAVFD
jgi:hypothetical protein